MEKHTKSKACKSKSHRRWVMPLVFFVAQQSHALGLGDIQVDSYLGEPLKAQVDLTDLMDDYESSLKVRLASPEEYKKHGYAYPYDVKFKFSIVNENGKQPMVRITSLRSIEDPYLNLLLEVTSPTGRIIRDFTFLIDPSPEMLRNQELLQAIPVPKLASAPTTTPTMPLNADTHQPLPPLVPHQDVPKKTGRKQTGKSAPHSVEHRAKTKPQAQTQRYVSKLDPDGQLSNKLSLSLSTSLTISSRDPNAPASAKENNDVLQEELIAKEKTLKEMNEQIAEMHEVIKVLQGKLSLTVSSGVPAASGITAIPVASAVATQVASAPAAKVVVTAPVNVAEGNQLSQIIAWLKLHSKALLAGLSVTLLGLLGFYWYRKRKLESGWIPNGLFDDLEQTAAPIATETVAAPPVVTKKLDVGAQSMKVPAYKEQKAQSNLPAEYDLLEEADIYLRFGHDKLAEEVLRDALKINDKNPEIYLTLLGIFDTRGDAQGFEAIALAMKPIANEDMWKKVVAMGKKLDIANALYA